VEERHEYKCIFQNSVLIKEQVEAGVKGDY
jgi:hypothetical protein